ncbi:MAG: mercuric reductase [Phycisphaerae bacterium]|nr:mercuric reductase [Phycisphaerae bacterium]
MAPDGLIKPWDAHNEALLQNAHPPDWVNPEPSGRYNLVVIGAGTAGLVTAAGAAGMGAQVALIERHLMGGDCLNFGCVPSKTIIRSSRTAHEIRTAGRFGVCAGDGVTVDFASVMERMRRIRSHISEHDSAQRFGDLGIDVHLGEARFTGPDTVQVAGKTLRFARACIATGARAAVPGTDGLEEAGFLTNETVFSLTDRPARLAVLGGGPIGCELGQAFARLGSHVTLIHSHERLLPREDADVSGILLEAFRREDIPVLLNARILRVRASNGGKMLTVASEGRERTVEVDEILVATGRQPNVEDLGLEAAGVTYDRRQGVLVNDRLQTRNPRIYAAGDVCMRHKFTHAADAAARIVIQNALFWGRKKLSALTIPWCSYTDPEVAHVGLYEHEAQTMGIEVETLTRHFEDVDRAVTDGTEEGIARVHVKKGTDKILGATIVAAHAGDMINEITLAMVAGIGLGTLGGVIHPYPTQAEAIKQLGDAYNRTRLTPLLKKVFTKILAWRR